MENSLLITVNLPGAIGGPVRSIHKQKNTILTEEGHYTRTITHTDREESLCHRVMSISGEVVKEWLNGSCPEWVNLRCPYNKRDEKWRRLRKDLKLSLYIDGFDEGFGVDYEIINDGEN